VKWFNDTESFGCVTPKGGGADLRAHLAAIRSYGFKALSEGRRIALRRRYRPQGPTSVERSFVRLIEVPAPAWR
jgi:CspA family cold shock protein